MKTLRFAEQYVRVEMTHEEVRKLYRELADLSTNGPLLQELQDDLEFIVDTYGLERREPVAENSVEGLPERGTLMTRGERWA